MTLRSFGLSLALALAVSSAASAQQKPNVVSDESLRVCADPANLPFSDRDGGGFENKIAELVAAELKLPLTYYYMTEGPGFVRNTLGTKLCDVILGYAQGAGPVQNTNAYYRSAFVLITKADGPLAGVETLADPALKDRRLGIVAGTPAGDWRLAAARLSGRRVGADPRSGGGRRGRERTGGRALRVSHG